MKWPNQRQKIHTPNYKAYATPIWCSVALKLPFAIKKLNFNNSLLLSQRLKQTIVITCTKKQYFETFEYRFVIVSTFLVYWFVAMLCKTNTLDVEIRLQNTILLSLDSIDKWNRRYPEESNKSSLCSNFCPYVWIDCHNDCFTWRLDIRHRYR